METLRIRSELSDLLRFPAPLTDYEELDVVQEMDVDDMGHPHVHFLADSLFVVRAGNRPDHGRIWSNI